MNVDYYWKVPNKNINANVDLHNDMNIQNLTSTTKLMNMFETFTLPNRIAQWFVLLRIPYNLLRATTSILTDLFIKFGFGFDKNAFYFSVPLVQNYRPVVMMKVEIKAK